MTRSARKEATAQAPEDQGSLVSIGLVSSQSTSLAEATERHAERVYGQTKKHPGGRAGEPCQ